MHRACLPSVAACHSPSSLAEAATTSIVPMRAAARWLVPVLLWLAATLASFPTDLAASPVPGLGNQQQVVVGGEFSCALGADAAVRCWGQNSLRQLGDGTSTSRELPVEVAGLPGPSVQISAGGAHACARLVDGRVFCWGRNFNGELGDGSNTVRGLPVQVIGLPGPALEIAASGFLSCALVEGGQVLCWGLNQFRGLQGDHFQSNSPVLIPGFAADSRAIAVAGGHVCARDAAGGVRCWGTNSDGRLGTGDTVDALESARAVTGLPPGIVEVVAGGNHSCARDGAGSVHCWGSNMDGQLGLEGPANRLLPSLVSLDRPSTSVAAAGRMTCTINDLGAPACWGFNEGGELGDGTTISRHTPAPVASLASAVKLIAPGGTHACALLDRGAVSCWGSNSQGQLGDGFNSRRLTAFPGSELGSGFVRLAAGARHSCAVREDGSVLCWGSNRRGQLGDGETGRARWVAETVPGLSAAPVLAAGEEHSCATDHAGQAWCWGDNTLAQLGTGMANPAAFPDPQPVAQGALVFRTLTSGLAHTCALTEPGAAWCWGASFFGQVGDGLAGSSRPNPSPVTGLDGGTLSIAAGGQHTCAVTSTGGVVCWGINQWGQLGDGSTTSRLVPVPVSGLDAGAVQVVGGSEHSCARLENGEVRCWGRNLFGSLGDGTGIERRTPVAVQGLPAPALALAAGDFHTCALLDSGNLWCWGSNSHGQLGDGTRRTRLLPQEASGPAGGFLAVSASGSHSCAIAAGGAVSCWGLNDFGQLGDGGRDTTRPAPVRYDAPRRALTSPSLGGDGASLGAASDGSGRYLVFASDADNLHPMAAANPARDIFRTDRLTGTTELVSVDDAGSPLLGAAQEPSVSADGQWVVFVAADAAVGKLRGESKHAREARQKSGTAGVFLRNMLTGTTTRIGTARPGGEGTQPQIAPGGGSVVFTGTVSVPGEGVVGQDNVFQVPLLRQGGEPVVGPAECLSCTAGAGGPSDGASREPTVSADGEWVAWTTEAKNLVAGAASPCAGSNGTEVVLRNMLTGVVRRVSPPADLPAANCGQLGSGKPSLDWAGSRLALASDLALDPSDQNDRQDVYVLDLQQDTTLRVSADPATGHPALLESGSPRLSGNGRQVAFVSSATNVESSEADDNQAADVLVFAINERLARRVSSNARGDQAQTASQRPALNFDGSVVMFDTEAGNLLFDGSSGQTVDGNGVADVFVTRSPFLTRGGPQTVFADGFDGF